MCVFFILTKGDEIEKQQNKQKNLVEGDLVRSNREFPNVPTGSFGKVLRIDQIPAGKEKTKASYAIEWQDLPGYKEGLYNNKLVDWFAEDELQFLDKQERRNSSNSFNESLWKQLIENGRSKEKGVTNNLADIDVITTKETLEFFGIEAAGLIIFDLHVAKYKVYDALGMWLQGRLSKNDQSVSDNDNIFVALANVYIHTKYVSQFVDYLRFMDLELDQGKWNTPDFIKKIDQWTEDDLKLMKGQRRL